jgi:heme A synthase
LLLLQAGLGIATLLAQVPIPLALAHQSIAIAALIVATIHAADLRASGAGAPAGQSVVAAHLSAA